MSKLGLQGWRKGILFGFQLGVLTWGSLILGLYSISTASPILLLGWFLGQTAEFGIAGAVAGHGLAERKLSRLFFVVVSFVLISIVAGIIWQNVAGTPGESLR